MRRVVGRPARHVRGHQLAADVAVHRAAGHADDAGGPADAAPGHRHGLAVRAHQHRGRHPGHAHHVAHRLLEGAQVADGQQRVLLLHEQRGGRQPRGLVGLGVAGVLDPRDDLVDVVPAVEVALVGHEPRQEAVRRLDLALRLGAARAAQLQLEAGGLGELVRALDLEAPAALDRHQGGHVARDPLARHAAEPRDRGLHAPDQVVGRPGPRPDEYVPAGMAQRRREHVELEQLAVAVRHLDGLLPVELQLQSGRRLEARVRLRAAGGPDGDAVLAHELGEGVVAGQVLAGIPVQQPLVDALLGDSRQLRLGGHLLDVRVERARPVAAPVVGSPALGPPVRRHGVPVLAVALRYVAEVGLYARFPVHVQLSDQVLLRHGPLLPKASFARRSKRKPRRWWKW